MKTHEQTPPATDEFEPIELGSVSEETRGGNKLEAEYFVGPNSRI